MINIFLKTALVHIRRSPFQALAAVSVLVVTFFVATIISILVYSSSRLLTFIETRPQIIAFLKNDITPQAISTLQKKLNNDERIKDLRYVPKEEALEIYKKATTDNPLLAELVSPAIFPASLEFTVTDLSFTKDIVEEVKKDEIVDSVRYTASLGGQESLTDVVERLRNITYSIRGAGVIFVLVLTVTSFMVLLVVISMRISTRKAEIETLDLLGATAGFINTPIVIEAVFYAILGTTIGWLAAFILILYATPEILNYFQQIPVLPKDTLKLIELLAVVYLGEMLIGVLIAVGGSFMAVSRARR